MPAPPLGPPVAVTAPPEMVTAVLPQVVLPVRELLPRAVLLFGAAPDPMPAAAPPPVAFTVPPVIVTSAWAR